MENQNQADIEQFQPTQKQEPNLKGSFFKFASIMVAMVIVGLLASYVWQTYFSPEARQNRQLQEQYENIIR